MISTKDLKGQIDELSEQNKFLTQQLQLIQETLLNLNQNQRQNQGQYQNHPNSNHNGSQGQGQGQGQDQSQGQNQGQGQNQNQRQNQNQGQNQNQSGGSQSQGGGPGSGQGGSQGGDQSGNAKGQIPDIANEFLKLKGMTSYLEQKMYSYTSSNTNGGNLTQEDVVTLVLNMMNGMIDWTMDYVSRQSGQQQSS